MVQLVEMIYQSSSCLSLCLISLILILGRGDSKAQRLAFQPKMPHIHHFATCFLHFFWYLPSKSNTSPFFSLDVLVVLLYPGKSDTSHHFTPFFPAQEPCVAHTHGGAPTIPLLWSQGTQVRPSTRGEWGFLMGTQPARWTYLRDVGGFNGNTIGIEWKMPFFPPFLGIGHPQF